jgi:hypothetical protein
MISLDDQPESSISIPVTAVRTVTLQKSKDVASGLTLGSYILRVVDIGLDDDGDPETSCVIEWLDDAAPRKAADRRTLTPPMQKALNELHELMIAGRGMPANRHDRAPDGAPLIKLSEWRDACRERGLTKSGVYDTEKKAFSRAADALEKANYIATFGNDVWLLGGQNPA